MSTTAQPGVADGVGTQTPPAAPLSPLVEMQGLTVRFGDREILSGLTASFNRMFVSLQKAFRLLNE